MAVCRWGKGKSAVSLLGACEDAQGCPVSLRHASVQVACRHAMLLSPMHVRVAYGYLLSSNCHIAVCMLVRTLLLDQDSAAQILCITLQC